MAPCVLGLKLLEHPFCGHTGQCTSWSKWLKLYIILYVCNMSALRLRYTKVGNFSCLKRSVYVSVRNAGTSLVALRWILSMASESLFSFGNHIQLAYSRCGLIIIIIINYIIILYIIYYIYIYIIILYYIIN